MNDLTHYHYLTLHRYGTTRSFGVARSFVIGRSENADIHLRDLRVSRLHCRVEPEGTGLRLEEISAANRTLVNSELIARGAPVVLQVGDWVRIGPYDLQVEVREEWLHEEPAWERARTELRRLERRGRVRAWAVFILAGIVAVAVGIRTWRKKPLFDASVTFLLKEHRGTDGRMAPPPPKAQLRQYVFDGIFTRQSSLRVVKKFNLFSSQRALDENWAVEEMRDHVDVRVYQNQFLLPDGNEEPDRTARVQITYHGRSAREALKVARDLGKMLRKHEAKVRDAAALSAVSLIRTSIRAVARRIDDVTAIKRKLEASVAREGATKADKAVAAMRIRQLDAMVDNFRNRLAGENTRLARAVVIAGREKKSLGIRFELVDWGRMPPPRLSLAFKGTIVGVIVFVFAIPILGMLIGVLDRRLYDTEDITRLGIPSLGQVGEVPGLDVGSLDQRIAADAQSRAPG